MVQGVDINLLKRLRTKVKRKYSFVVLCFKRQCLMIADTAVFKIIVSLGIL
jgi:hypothetical protein